MCQTQKLVPLGRSPRLPAADEGTPAAVAEAGEAAFNSSVGNLKQGFGITQQSPRCQEKRDLSAHNGQHLVLLRPFSECWSRGQEPEQQLEQQQLLLSILLLQQLQQRQMWWLQLQQHHDRQLLRRCQDESQQNPKRSVHRAGQYPSKNTSHNAQHSRLPVNCAPEDTHFRLPLPLAPSHVVPPSPPPSSGPAVPFVGQWYSRIAVTTSKTESCGSAQTPEGQGADQREQERKRKGELGEGDDGGLEDRRRVKSKPEDYEGDEGEEDDEGEGEVESKLVQRHPTVLGLGSSWTAVQGDIGVAKGEAQAMHPQGVVQLCTEHIPVRCHLFPTPPAFPSGQKGPTWPQAGACGQVRRWPSVVGGVCHYTFGSAGEVGGCGAVECSAEDSSTTSESDLTLFVEVDDELAGIRARGID